MGESAADARHNYFLFGIFELTVLLGILQIKRMAKTLLLIFHWVLKSIDQATHTPQYFGAFSGHEAPSLAAGSSLFRNAFDSRGTSVYGAKI